MKENGFETGRSMENLSGHLKRFFDDSPEQALEAIQEVQEENPNATKGEIFQKLSAQKGHGKSHASQFTAPQHEGKLKRS